jgi:hypothetical protein
MLIQDAAVLVGEIPLNRLRIFLLWDKEKIFGDFALLGVQIRLFDGFK